MASFWNKKFEKTVINNNEKNERRSGDNIELQNYFNNQGNNHLQPLIQSSSNDKKLYEFRESKDSTDLHELHKADELNKWNRAYTDTASESQIQDMLVETIHSSEFVALVLLLSCSIGFPFVMLMNYKAIGFQYYTDKQLTFFILLVTLISGFIVMVGSSYIERLGGAIKVYKVTSFYAIVNSVLFLLFKSNLQIFSLNFSFFYSIYSFFIMFN